MIPAVPITGREADDVFSENDLQKRPPAFGEQRTSTVLLSVKRALLRTNACFAGTARRQHRAERRLGIMA